MSAKFRALTLCFMILALCCTLTGCMDAMFEYLQPGYSKPATGLQSQNTQIEDDDSILDTESATSNKKPGKETTPTTPATTVPPTTVPATTAPTEPAVEEEEESSKILCGYITGEPLNVRSGPGKEYEVVDTLHINNTVYIYETQDGWGRTDKGWISMDYFSIEPVESEKPADVVIRTGYITGEPLNIRSGPGKDYESVGFLYKGDYVEIFETSGDWGRIDKGWINLDYVG